MQKQNVSILSIMFIFIFLIGCSSEQNDSGNIEPIIDPKIKEETHVPITAFWWNGGWDHYDASALEYIDEIIIFAIPANPDTGDLLKHSSSTLNETVYIKGKTSPGLTTTMIRTITEDATANNVKVTLGINGMGRKEKYFNDLVRNNKHEIFADSILSFCKRWKIDGVDIDYEHVSNDEDAGFLTAIVTALGDKLHPEGFHVSGAFGINRAPVTKWLANNHKLLDQVNVMGYLNTPSKTDEMINELHTTHGVPKNKIFSGVGFYAKGKDQDNNTLSYNYRDLVNIITVDNTEDIFYVPNPNNASETVALEFNNSEQSLQTKVNMIRDNGFGGVMVWALNHDVPAVQENSRIKYLRNITNGK